MRQVDEVRHEQLLGELRGLLDTITGRAEDYLRGCASAEGGEVPGDCGWCPVCAAVALLRGQRSEIAERLVEQLSAAAQALRELLAEHRNGPAPGDPEEEPTGSEQRSERVQSIDVRRIDGRVLDDPVLDGEQAQQPC